MSSCKERESVESEKFSDLLKANSELMKDVSMLKQLVYCLNSQLGRYQKLYFLNQKSHHPNKLSANVIPPLPESVVPPEPNELSINVSMKGTNCSKSDRVVNDKNVSFIEKLWKDEGQEASPKTQPEDEGMIQKTRKTADGVGSRIPLNRDLLTLAPLLDAYEETIKEKDSIIKTYEQKMLALGQKCREVVLENEALFEEREKLMSKCKDNPGKILQIDERNIFLEEQNKLLKEYLDLEKEKFIEVHEIYEGKFTELTEELNKIKDEHRRSLAELSDAKGRCDFLTGEVNHLRRIAEDSIPMSVHNQSINECRRLLEELRVQYEKDNLNTLTKLKEIEKAKMKLMNEVAELTDLKNKSEKLLKTKEHLLRRNKQKFIQVCVRLMKSERQNELLRDNLRVAVSFLEDLSKDSSWNKEDKSSLMDENCMQQRILLLHAALQTFQHEARKELDLIERRLKLNKDSNAVGHLSKEKPASNWKTMEKQSRETNTTKEAGPKR